MRILRGISKVYSVLWNEKTYGFRMTFSVRENEKNDNLYVNLISRSYTNTVSSEMEKK